MNVDAEAAAVQPEDIAEEILQRLGGESNENIKLGRALLRKAADLLAAKLPEEELDVDAEDEEHEESGTEATNKSGTVLFDLEASGVLMNDEVDEQITRLTLMVPNELTASIVGKRGSNVNQLQQQTGARISVKRTGGRDNEVEMEGKLAAVCKAQTAISLLLQSDMGQLTMLVNPCAPAVIIGQKGETIKKLQAETGGHFSMVRNAAHRGMQVATVKGEVQCQCRLMYQICRAVARAQAKSDTELTVPSAPSFPMGHGGHRFSGSPNYYNNVGHGKYGGKGGKGMGMGGYDRRGQHRYNHNNNIHNNGAGANVAASTAAGANGANGANGGMGEGGGCGAMGRGAGVQGGNGGNLANQGAYQQAQAQAQMAQQMAMPTAGMAGMGMAAPDGAQWDGMDQTGRQGMSQGQGGVQVDTTSLNAMGVGIGQQMGAVMGMGMGLGGLGGHSGGNAQQQWQQRQTGW